MEGWTPPFHGACRAATHVSETERAWQALGDVRYRPMEGEQKNKVFRPSIYAAADIAEGEVFMRRTFGLCDSIMVRRRNSIGNCLGAQRGLHSTVAIYCAF